MLVHKYQEMVYAYAFHKVRNEARCARHHAGGLPKGLRPPLSTPAPTSLPKLAVYHHVQRVQTMAGTRVTKKRRREIALEEAADEALLG